MTESNDRNTPIYSLREQVREFVQEREWEKFHSPKNLCGSVAIEAAELQELFQWLTTGEAEEISQNDDQFKQAVAEELSDVLIHLLSLANVLDIDVSEAVAKKLGKNRIKYPAQQYRGIFRKPTADTANIR